MVGKASHKGRKDLEKSPERECKTPKADKEGDAFGIWGKTRIESGSLDEKSICKGPELQSVERNYLWDKELL